MKRRLLIVGGRQRKKALDLDEWQAYEKAVILKIDLDSFSIDTVLEHETPPALCAEQNPAIVFKAGDLDEKNHRLIVCTQTEILEFDTLSWQQTFSFSHASFNDVHHVCYQDQDHLLVANTGLDQILQIAIDRENHSFSKIAQEWPTGKTATWDRFDPKIDYRKVPTTKPHESHPNFVFCHGGRVYATRFHQKDAIDVEQKESTFDIEAGNPHDGIVDGHTVIFTTTNGMIVDFDLESGKRTRTVDLNSISSQGQLLGWCRGIRPVHPQSCWIGFSRIRPTWLRKNLSWIKQGFRTKGEYGTEPTRVAEYDLENRSLIRELDLEKEGMNAVFGIYLESIP